MPFIFIFSFSFFGNPWTWLSSQYNGFYLSHFVTAFRTAALPSSFPTMKSSPQYTDHRALYLRYRNISQFFFISFFSGGECIVSHYQLDDTNVSKSDNARGDIVSTTAVKIKSFSQFLHSFHSRKPLIHFPLYWQFSLRHLRYPWPGSFFRPGLMDAKRISFWNAFFVQKKGANPPDLRGYTHAIRFTVVSV